ncbi:MAG TPA: TetR/AcrR family transcriptional regulator [Polyangiales bacterium]
MRKRPQQQRSRQVVASLVDATAVCVARYGFEATTTPKIAEIAGVSVGSLYQYFESKETLFEALMERLGEDVSRILSVGAQLGQHLPIEQQIGSAIRGALALLHTNEGLYLELVRNWHRLPTHRVADIVERHLLDLMRIYFTKHHREVRVHDLHTKIFIIVNSTIFTVVRYLSGEHPLISEDEIARGLTEMIDCYLRNLPEPAPPLD